MYNELPGKAKIEITTEGGWPKESSTTEYPVIPALIPEKGSKQLTLTDFPEQLRKPFTVLTKMKKLLADEKNSNYEIAFVDEAIKTFEVYPMRLAIDPGPGYYRPITDERRNGINNFYQQTALSMYNGLAKRMENYAMKGDIHQKHMAELFSSAQK